MSALTRFFTFEVMENATVQSVSTEATGHPAEHAIAPLEPNFAWEANETSAQHTITIDLSEIRICDGFIYRHHETETPGPPVAFGPLITVERSNDNALWTTLDLSQNDDGSSLPADSQDSSIPFKTRYFIKSGVLQSFSARYFRFTLAGIASPNYYAPAAMRTSILWLFTFNELDKSASYPVNDITIYPTVETPLPFGKVYKTGLSINPSVEFTKTWMVTATEYELLLTVLEKCNGTYRPFLFIENDGIRRLCKFGTDQFEETLFDTDIYYVTAKIIELPLLGKDKIH